MAIVMIRGGDGKLKGRRNRRDFWPPMRYRTRRWRRSDWRFVTRIAPIESSGEITPDIFKYLAEHVQ